MTAPQDVTTPPGGPIDVIELGTIGDAEKRALAAADALGTALRDSAEFAALARADQALATDADAQAAMEAFERRQEELRMEITFRTLSPEHRSELDRLQAAMFDVPAVATYVAAQAALANVCRQAAAVVTSEIGIDFAANCGSKCCG